uniref:S100P-binding protein n=1 Tax=Geotrypetes seraphini TaxID=260995 RepID=A0A6P8S2A0_GEOSA|nr:S100P-binding protein-like [Geotrypetes seraphini]XP_033811178.1 S100P-binding protein-like [Geotrypetes seraphini]
MEGNEIRSKLRGKRRMRSTLASAQCPDRKSCCDREVLCSVPDDIKIRIVNERASETKRLLNESLEEEQVLHGAFKKPRLMYPYCSTPCPALKEAFSSPDSACFPGSSSCFDETQTRKLVLPSDPLASFSPASKPDQNELDDSLLEASDGDADSPLHLTEEQMQKLLEDDWSAAGMEREPLYSEHSSPEESEELEHFNSQLFTRSVLEGPSLTQSTLFSASSILLTLDETECERSISLDQNCLECNEINNIPFDCDIEDILALSPIDRSSIEQENDDYVLLENTEVQDGCLRGATDLLEKQKLMPFSNQNGEEELGEYAAEPEEYPLCLEECIAAPGGQALCNHSFPNPPADRELGKSQDGTAMASEAHSFKSINIPAKEGPDRAGESVSSAPNASLQKPKLLKRVALPQDNVTLKEVISPKDDRGENLQGKKPGKAALSKAEERHLRIPPAELEKKKQDYVQCVLKHHKQINATHQDAYKECLTLMDQVANKGWLHPLNLTLRCYPRSSKKLPNKRSLKQWVSQNGAHGRFANLDARFQRSSVVALPS